MMEVNLDNNSREVAVMVKNAYKKYGSGKFVLNRLNMTVFEGTIYGLLGPSGCGKTTLLNCILGTSKLNSGEIKVKAKTISKVGYMPQDICLYKDLSIIELMTFYGRIFNFDDYVIGKRTNELMTFLDLPSKSRLIKGLSGGQQRRVSFAVALLHDPQLIILDEPTVGVDPLLCERIWERLLQMVENENKTVIVTTHYIEEAGQAHTIGFSRNGKLLAEDSPAQLMLQYDCASLEEVFLQLCQTEITDAPRERSSSVAVPTYPMLANRSSGTPRRQNFKCSWKVVLGLMIKMILWIRRNLM